MDWRAISDTALAILTTVGFKILGAVALWIVGNWLVDMMLRMSRRALQHQELDATLTRYLQTSLSVLLKMALIVAILGVLGVETATFAALIAAAGVAIGLAWSGLLANFAAGAFLVFLRPFKVGDAVAAGGITGTVDTIGLFGTTFNSPENVLTIVPNNKIFSDTIQNFSANPYRRVSLTAAISSTVDHQKAISLLKSRLLTIPNVLASPQPEVDLLEMTPAGSLLCVRPFCRNEHYAQVYFDANRTVREAFNEAGFPAPVQYIAVPNPG